MPATIEELNNTLQTTLKSFREENDKAMAEVEKHGKVSAATAEKVDKLDGSINDVKDQVKALSNNVSEKLAALSVGGAAGGAMDAKQRYKALKAFNKLPRNGSGPVNQEQLDAYSNAFTEYLRAGDVNNLAPEVKAAMSVGYEQGGGYWVSPDKSGPIIKKLYETTPFRQLATVATISTDALEGIVDNDEAGAGWVAEKQARPKTPTPEIGKYRIDVHEMYANPQITQQLLDDSEHDVEGWLRDKVAEKFARMENSAFISGNGSGKPRGILDYATSAAPTKWDQIQYLTTGVSAGFATPTATVSPADAILELIYALKSGYRAGASFIAARQTLGVVRKMKDGQGNYLSGISIKDGAFNETIFGFPVTEGDDMPAIGANSFSIAFGNWKAAYIIVDRQGVKVLVDPYTNKPYVGFYTTKRTGGGLVNGEAVKLLKFGTA